MLELKETDVKVWKEKVRPPAGKRQPISIKEGFILLLEE
jgi:hypothetical protein